MVYTLGGSAFKGAVGSMMIEVIPFLHIMFGMIEEEMKGQDPRAILATIMMAYALSSIMTSIAFLLLGYYKLGNLIHFFPRHILVGCIGGIGVFLILTGIEVTSGVTPALSLQAIKIVFAPAALKLWGPALGVALLLKLLQTFISHPLFLPAFYLTIPVIFYIVVVACGIPLAELRQNGWLFDLTSKSGTSSPFWTYWTYYDFGLVDWSAVARKFYFIAHF